jgi:hypothetical protein
MFQYANSIEEEIKFHGIIAPEKPFSTSCKGTEKEL